jgi:hypothetical protein
VISLSLSLLMTLWMLLVFRSVSMETSAPDIGDTIISSLSSLKRREMNFL